MKKLYVGRAHPDPPVFLAIKIENWIGEVLEIRRADLDHVRPYLSSVGIERRKKHIERSVAKDHRCVFNRPVRIQENRIAKIRPINERLLLRRRKSTEAERKNGGKERFREVKFGLT